MRRLLLLAALLPAACSRGSAPEEELSTEPGVIGIYEDPEGLYSVELPSNWLKARDPGTRTRNVSFLLRTYRPGSRKEVVIYAMSVYYYPPRHPRHPSANDYVRAMTLELPTMRLGPVETLEVGGRKAARWTAESPAVASPDLPEPERVKETHVVVNAKSGFFALTYSSPAELHGEQEAAFKMLLDSFQVKHPRL